jgi:GGDEF domain-containing protein
MRQSVADLVVPGTDVRTSMSVGMVSYPDDGRTADELMLSADRAMYASKRLGKNRVMGAPTGAAGRADAPV